MLTKNQIVSVMVAQKRLSRSHGERIRVAHHIQTMRTVLDSVEIALGTGMGPVGMELPQHVMGAAHHLAATLTRLDAYQRAEDDNAQLEAAAGKKAGA